MPSLPRLATFALISLLFAAGIGATLAAAGPPETFLLASPPDKAWLDLHVGDRLTGKVLLGLTAGDQVVVLYRESKPGGEIRLSILDGKKERQLWSYADGDAVTSSQVPPPVLAACHLNDGPAWDIILCTSVNEAGGQHNERWSRHMRVFLDGDASLATTIPLAAVDLDTLIDGTNPRAPLRYSALSDPKKPALRRDACAIIRPGAVFLISSETRFRSETEEQSPRPAPPTIQAWHCDGPHLAQQAPPAPTLPAILLDHAARASDLVLR
jgi:hypothetical protein